MNFIIGNFKKCFFPSRISVRYLSLPPIPVPVSKIRTSGNSFCGPVVRTLYFPCQDPGSVSGGGTKILQAKWLGGKKKCSFDD